MMGDHEKESGDPKRTTLSVARGSVDQIDFLTAALLVIFGTAFFYGLTFSGVSSLSSPEREPEAISTRVVDRLADDVVRNDVSSAFANQSCIESYVSRQASSPCWSGFDDSSDAAYLHTSMGVSYNYTINVTVSSDSDFETVDCGFSGGDCSLGPEVPSSGTVAIHHRRVVWKDGDDAKIQVLYVAVWDERSSA